MPAMAPGARPPPPDGVGCPAGPPPEASGAGAVDAGADPLEPGPKATTFLAEGASRRSSPTLGVGKWLAGTPITACRRTAPVAGSRPYKTPFWPMVQIKPAAIIGGPPPLPELHSRRSPGGEVAARTALMPLRQGR